MSTFLTVEILKKALEDEQTKSKHLTDELAIEKSNRRNCEILLKDLRKKYGEANIQAEAEEEAFVNKVF